MKMKWNDVTAFRWPEPIFMRVGYGFESSFSAEKIQQISMIFGILNKKIVEL